MLDAHVRLHVHLKLDTAFTVSGKIPNGNDIKRKCMRKLVMFFQSYCPRTSNILITSVFSEAHNRLVTLDIHKTHLHDIISYHKR